MWMRRDFVRTATVSLGAAAAGGLLTTGAEAAAGARVLREVKVDARTRDLTVRSPAMGRDLKVRILLPEGWNKRRTWPVLWLLHGGKDDHRAWTKYTKIAQMSASRKMIVVMPDGGENATYTDWLSGPKWETFHTKELRALLFSRYSASKRQAVAGLSSGGYGALIYAARHKGMFRFAGSYSGYGSTLVPGAPEVLMTGLPGSGMEKFLMWGQPQINRDVWEAHDPTTLAHRLRGVSLYISCAKNGVKGPLDPADAQAVDPAEAFVYYTVKPLVARLKKLKIPAKVHLYARGTHNWRYYRREFVASWPMICKALRV